MNTYLTKHSGLPLFDKELPNKDLLYISYTEDIPELHRNAYFEVSFNDNGEIVMTDKSKSIPDPSTIYIYLPIMEEQDVPSLPYWPHYIEMTPGQRFRYLTWLRDVEQPIDMGYVFIYYYGLERHLLTDDFDRAFDEIIKLRNVHKNKSFLTYSENALIHGAILRNRIDRLMDLHERTEITGYSNALFLIAYNENIDLGGPQLSLIFHKSFPLSRKDMATDRELFNECIRNALLALYEKESINIGKYNINKVKTKTETRFANYSFSPELQTVEITDFYQCKELMADLESIFRTAHEYFKQEMKVRKSNKSPEETYADQLKRNENRYKKLLKEKKITDVEYKILSDYNKSRSANNGDGL